MTLDFAKQEAKRRTDVLGTTHYVIQSRWDGEAYYITAYPPLQLPVVATYEPKEVQ